VQECAGGSVQCAAGNVASGTPLRPADEPRQTLLHALNTSASPLPLIVERQGN